MMHAWKGTKVNLLFPCLHCSMLFFRRSNNYGGAAITKSGAYGVANKRCIRNNFKNSWNAAPVHMIHGLGQYYSELLRDLCRHLWSHLQM